MELIPKEMILPGSTRAIQSKISNGTNGRSATRQPAKKTAIIASDSIAPANAPVLFPDLFSDSIMTTVLYRAEE
jgi:hypothetical protein